MQLPAVIVFGKMDSCYTVKATVIQARPIQNWLLWKERMLIKENKKQDPHFTSLSSSMYVHMEMSPKLGGREPSSYSGRQQGVREAHEYALVI